MNFKYLKGDLDRIDTHFFEERSGALQTALEVEAKKVEKHAKLKGSFWCVCSYFNFTNSSIKRKNFGIFREHLKKQGAKLLVVEYLIAGQAPDLTAADSDMYIRLEGPHILWQKERLINYAVGKLPDDCDKVAWLDSDVIFNEDDWTGETAALLERFKIVQPFSYAYFTAREQDLSLLKDLPKLAPETAIRNSFARWYWMRKKEIVNYSPPGPSPLMVAPGLAWAARRSVLEQVGLYENTVLGGGDFIFASAAIGQMYCQSLPWTPNSLQRDIDRYSEMLFSFVENSIFYRQGIITHLWHGDPANRRYKERHKILLESHFDPQADLNPTGSGALEWGSEKLELHRRVREYFWGRKEHL